ncbi:putative ABC transport system permease protein [Lacibacter cauensis]|uniref:Putative ABC transport system permease protein n=1 Tax=Lacibacter cauensis TaxID=510947 RepID=A0A562SFI4_9BACT|nr:ABC transporter permease [Lacibacter cauensis]TWI79350.1 putative ABC transport system permease protein [Lacibacter cauensis]
MFRNYLKTAFRNLAKNKVYSFINIAGLSIGLACAMLILLYTKDEASYDRFLPGVNNIYRIVSKEVNPDGSILMQSGNTGSFHGPAFASGVPEIVSFVRFQGDYVNIKKGTEVLGQDAHRVDSNFFSIMQFPLVYGNGKTALQQPDAIVLSETVARKFFGSADVVGKTLQLQRNGTFKPYTVTAVAKDCPQNSSIKFQMLTKMELSAEEISDRMNWFNFFLNTFVVLAPGADAKQVEKKMMRFYEMDARETIKIVAEKYNYKAKAQYTLQPYTDIHLSKEYRADNGMVGASNPMYSYILSGIALFILLIACINFVNLTVARSLKRAREIGVRKVIGSDRRQLIGQFLGESYILCFIAFVLALGIAQLLLPFFNDLSNKALSLTYLFDVKLVSSYAALFLVTGFLAGFYPALVLSGFNPVETLYNRFRLTGKNYLQRSLVVLQFSLATLLIIATVVMYRQFQFLVSKDLGYNDKHVLTVPNVTGNKIAVFRQELLKNPNIEQVAIRNNGFNVTLARINGNKELEFTMDWVDADYLPLYKIPVIQGRNFSRSFSSDTASAVIVNEAFVKAAGWKDAVGQVVDFWYNNKKYTVVGVVKDYHYAALNEVIKPQLLCNNEDNFGLAVIRIKEGSAAAVLPFIEQQYKSIVPLQPYSYEFKDISNQRQYEAEAKWKKMLLFGAVLTIFISCIGLFGLSVLAAEKRLKEVGVRKVLGASVTTIATALSKDFLLLVVISLFIAMPIAWLLANKWLQNYPYRAALSWWLFAAAGAGVVLLALLTVSFQAIRAAMAKPVKSLRTE